MHATPKTGATGSFVAHTLITEAVRPLLSAALLLALSVALGRLMARWLRRRGLHWSWAAVTLLALLPFERMLGALAPGALLALLTAALRGRRLHHGDLDSGQDLGRAARERLTPLAALRRRLAPTRERAASRIPSHLPSLTDAAGRTGESLTLGRDRNACRVAIPFALYSPGHTLVVGATGSGKTVTQTLLAVRAIEQGRGAIVIDPKGDAELRRRLAQTAALTGRELVEWTPAGPTAYNPYARGGETEIADRLLAGERFTEPHYLRQAQRYLGHAVRTLHACDVEVSLSTAVEMLDPAALEQLLRHAPRDQAEAGHAYLDSLTARQLRDLAGVRDRLAILAESDAGRWLDAGAARMDGPTASRDRAAPRPSFDLLAAARARSVVYFGLEADSRPLLAQMIGAAIVQDLQSTVAALQAEPVPTLVVIDEFAAVSAEHVVALFGRARSAGLSLVLGTQEIADLRLPGRERVLEQVMGNLSLLIAHRQVVPASAELVSRLAGTRGTWRVSRSSGGRTTRTRSQEPQIAPEELTGLATGTAAVIGFGAAAGARLVRIEPDGGGR